MRLFALPAGVPALTTLADAIIADAFGIGLDARDPVALAGLTLYLPTRRAARAFAPVLAARLGLKGAVLPRIVPLGDTGDGDMLDLMAGDGPDVLANPEPVDPLARRLLLARLVRATARQLSRVRPADGGPPLLTEGIGPAFALAGDLASLLDSLQAELITIDRLRRIDTGHVDEWWQLTAAFLDILGERWPDMLKERGLIDPVAHRNARLTAEAERLAALGRDNPVIAAGSTGSQGATAQLLRAIATAPRGAVVLPDPDLGMPEREWASLKAPALGADDRTASHPQALIARLLEILPATRADIRPLAGLSPHLSARRRLISDAMRPAEHSEAWADTDARMGERDAGEALAGVTLIAARDPREEALAIAVALRGALETPGRTAMLVTPDRGLAAAVGRELRRWQVEVDDSAGRPLAETRAGVFLGLVLDVALTHASAGAITALGRHGLTRLGTPRDATRAAFAALELAAFRGVLPEPGWEGVRAALASAPTRIGDRHASRPLKRLAGTDLDLAQQLLDRLSAIFAPLATTGAQALAPLLSHLRAALADLSRDEAGEPLALAGPDGGALATLIDDLARALEAPDAEGHGTLADLSQMLFTLAAETSVRSAALTHPRLAILGPLEARLIDADLTVLGGLNEGIWPGPAVMDLFVNRSMRRQIGLSAPERRIGQAAHDLTSALMGEEVILSRAARVGTSDTIPSRFWQRLAAVAPAAVWEAAAGRGNHLLALARSLDQPDRFQPAQRPRPQPPTALQPTSYSVSEVETLYRDPYAIFARRILLLDPLPPPGLEPDARDRGSVLHTVMERFAADSLAGRAEDVRQRLLAIGEKAFADVPETARQLWWPGFMALVPAIIGFERARRAAGALAIGTELSVADDIALPGGGHVRLSGRADRVERLPDGRLALIDFKSGSPPSPKQIDAFFAPQLTLLSALARRQTFTDATRTPSRFGPADVAEAAYVPLKSDKGNALTPKALEPEAMAKIDEHLEVFARLVGDFLSGARPFQSRFAPEFIRHDGDYDHLARAGEWELGGDDGDGA